MWLYKLTNRLNGRSYIGCSVNPVSHRISRHLYAVRKGAKDMAITCAIRKHGFDAFSLEVIGESQDYQELLRMEAQAIKEQNTQVPNGYNITAGGVGARRACSQETRSRISAKKIGKHPWNFGKRNANTIARYSRTRHVGGPVPGTPSPHRGKKFDRCRRNKTANRRRRATG